MTNRVLDNPYYHGTGTILDDPVNTYIAGVVIVSNDANMQRGTDFQLVCSGSTIVPTTANTTLVNGNDTLVPSSVTGTDPYTLTFPVSDLTKQVDPTGYVWTLTINGAEPETVDSDAIPLVIQAGWDKTDLVNPSFTGDSVLQYYSDIVASTGDDLEYNVTSTLDSGVNFSIAANGDRVVTEDNPLDWINPIILDIRVVQADGTIGATEEVILGSYNDTTPPLITLNGDANISVDQGSTYVELGATWTDNIDGTGNATPSGTVDTSVIDDYIISYNHTDTAGNAATTVIRTVSVVDPDVEIPEITLTGAATINLEHGATYVELGATWTDDIDGSGNVTDITDDIDNDELGTYTVRYNYTDNSGKAAVEVTRTVNVVDTTPATITIQGNNPETVEAGTDFVDAGATWTDDVDGTGNADAVSDVDTSVVDTYSVRYSYTDSSGNVSTEAVRIVNVVDTTAPIIELQGLPTIVVEVNGIYNEEGAIWTDAVDGTGYANVTSNLDLTTPGSYTIYYDYTDSSGNVATTVLRNVIVAKVQGSSDGGRYLALSKETHDLIKPFGGGVSRVNEGRFVVQQVKSKLRTWLGEWALDTTRGWVNQEDFERNYNLADLERRARVIILETDGVLSIVSLTSNYSNRKLTLEFKAKTIYGTIDLIVPWGVT